MKWTRKKQLGDLEATYFSWSLNNNLNQFARFRMTAKVHKTPWKTRPIVCCSGTFIKYWSKWLDYQLQKLKPFVSTYVKDSQQVLDKVRRLRLLPNA